MKATGIIRHVDDLGRIVIPKEIRRNLKIKEGDPLEIYVDNDGVCFKPYLEREIDEALAEVSNIAKPYLSAQDQAAIQSYLSDIRQLILKNRDAK